MGAAGWAAALALALCVLLLAYGLALVGSDVRGADRTGSRATTSPWPRRSLAGAARERLAHRLGPRVLGLISEKRRDVIRRRIDSAGRPGGLTLERYAGHKATSTALLGVLGLGLATMTDSLLFAPPLIYLGWLWPDLSLLGQAKRRQVRIDRDLPDFLDILAVTVSAGLGFRVALARVAEALGGPLGEEIDIALQQMAYGVSRRTAFESVRDRNESQPLSQFISALLQAEDLGAPLSDTLGAIAADLRKAFAQNARSEAARAVPRVSVITATVMVPGFVILMVATLVIGSGLDFGGIFG